MAQALVLAGKVRTGTKVLDKPGRILPADTSLMMEAPPRFVSRGGEKLEGFLEKVQIPVDGLHCLDLGASTGGFTDCILQRGAASVTCVDVGRGQLHQKICINPRVTNLEKLNARQLKAGDLPRRFYHLIVLDLSFISLQKVLPTAWAFLAEGGCLIALVKPQFEAKKKEADKGRGIIRDPSIHERVLDELRQFILKKLMGAEILAIEKSSIQGAKGNKEFLIGVRKAKTEARK
tara:strand:+ start:176 stop:877 length:702 start_codon:yes stop_codon:yes gene_type:complete